MILPANGKVVVIDDDLQEGLALVKVLSRNDIPAKYFDGVSEEELPPKPLKDVRIIFLDIILGTQAQKPKTKVSKAVGALRRIIDFPASAPYILITWTKDKTLIDPVTEKLQPRPMVVIDLEKYECKNENNEYDVSVIEKKLIEKCKDFQSWAAFLLWENLVNDCAGEIYKAFTTCYPQEKDKWDTNLKGVIHGLAEAVVGKGRIEDPSFTDKEKLRNALLGINGVFIDTLESAVQKNDLIEVGKITSTKITDEIKSKINTKIHLAEQGESFSPQTGNLYIIEKSSAKKTKKIIKEIVEKNVQKNKGEAILKSNPKLVELDITPRCDYAQDKGYTRFLSGIMLKGKFSKDCFKSTKFSYRDCPVMTIDGKDRYLLFDFRFFRSLTTGELKKSKYRIRHELVVDIQSSFSNHINRFGVTTIG